MKRIVKYVGWTVAGLVVAAGLAAGYIQLRGVPKYAVAAPTLRVEITPERVERGRRWVTMLCADCHTNPATGQLTGRLMTDAPAEFGPIVSRNITKHPVKGIGSWTDGELAYFLRTGIRRDGQYIPPPMVKLAHMSDEDLQSVIAFLRSDNPLVAPLDIDSPGRSQPSFLVKFLSYVAFKPLPFRSARSPRRPSPRRSPTVVISSRAWTATVVTHRTSPP
jgi:cytochrome c2